MNYMIVIYGNVTKIRKKMIKFLESRNILHYDILYKKNKHTLKTEGVSFLIYNITEEKFRHLIETSLVFAQYYSDECKPEFFRIEVI